MTNTKLTEQELFDAKIEEIRANRQTALAVKRLRSDSAINDVLRKESIQTLNAIVKVIADNSKLDEDELVSWAKGVRTSKASKEYGRIPALIFIITKSFAWPIVDKSDAREIEDIQEEINEALEEKSLPTLNIESVMDINEAKGYHSFMTDEGDQVDAVEPEYDQLEYSLIQFCETFDIPFIDFKLSASKWNRTEIKAVAEVEMLAQANQDAIDREEALNRA